MAREHLEMDQMVADPWGTLRRGRATGWVAETTFGPAILAHEDMRELLVDPRLRANFPEFLESCGITSGPFYEWMAMSPLNRDGADHLRWRALMGRTFTPRRVEGLRPFLRTAAHGLIDAFAARGTCDFVAEFADVYPSLGLCELIGVPQEDRDTFRDWANTIGLGFNVIALMNCREQVDAALVQLLDYTGRLAERRRADPRDDLVTRIAQAAGEDGYSLAETRGFIAGLVFAGHETTKNQLGWMMAVLGEHPDAWEDIAAGKLAVADVVEEVLRYRSAVAGVGRTVAAPVERKGEQFPTGAVVFLSSWSANHDERAYPHAGAFDPVANHELPHLAFGHGAHFCLGAALARAELQEALAALTLRIVRPALGSGSAWKPPTGINGPERLPITFSVR